MIALAVALAQLARPASAESTAASAPAPPATAPGGPAAAAPCLLPPARAGRLPWQPGERLAYDIDVMGVVRAGSLTLTAAPPMFAGAVLPLRARVQNSSVFAKVRSVSGVAVSWLGARSLRPDRYREEIVEDGVRKTVDARLADRPAGSPIELDWEYGKIRGKDRPVPRGEVLDLVSAFYRLRTIDLRAGQPICFDLVANRRLWHLRGEVATKPERVDAPAGSFEAFHFSGEATRDDAPGAKRQIHVWLSTDARRLPVAAVSEIDLGPVRAMLTRADSAKD